MRRLTLMTLSSTQSVRTALEAPLRSIPAAVSPKELRLAAVDEVWRNRGNGLVALHPPADRTSPPPEAVIARLPAESKYVIRGRDLQKQVVPLPFGLKASTTIVSARTLKKLAGGNWRAQLLKKVGDAWVFMGNDEKVDLSDESIELRLGSLQILS